MDNPPVIVNFTSKPKEDKKPKLAKGTDVTIKAAEEIAVKDSEGELLLLKKDEKEIVKAPEPKPTKKAKVIKSIDELQEGEDIYLEIEVPEFYRYIGTTGSKERGRIAQSKGRVPILMDKIKRRYTAVVRVGEDVIIENGSLVPSKKYNGHTDYMFHKRGSLALYDFDLNDEVAEIRDRHLLGIDGTLPHRMPKKLTKKNLARITRAAWAGERLREHDIIIFKKEIMGDGARHISRSVQEMSKIEYTGRPIEQHVSEKGIYFQMAVLGSGFRVGFYGISGTGRIIFNFGDLHERALGKVTLDRIINNLALYNIEEGKHFYRQSKFY